MYLSMDNDDQIYEYNNHIDNNVLYVVFEIFYIFNNIMWEFYGVSMVEWYIMMKLWWLLWSL